MLLDEPVRVHDADGILSPAEGADLEQQGLVLGHAQRAEDGRDLARPDLPVLLRERIDGRIDHVLRDAQPAAELGQREDRGVVLVDDLTEGGPHATLRVRRVEVAAPDPAPLAAMPDQRRGLHVVDDDQVGVEAQLLGVDPIHLDVVGQGLVGQHPLGAFQRRPQGGRGGVERGVAARDLPARVETEVLEQRHRRAQHLGGAFAEAAAGQVQDPPVAHTVAQALDDVHDPGRRHVTVVVQPDHAACVSRAWSTRPRTRARTRSRLVMNVSMRSMRWARASRPSDVRIHSAKSPDGRPSLARASTMWK